ncbi:MAG: hypothetical protein K0Q68_43 [Moraxellaceae bacterium]|nr:hypothetical protein [Moraxellaceae bacterium]
MPIFRIVIALLAATALSGCYSATRTLPADFYKAAATTGNKLPMRVAVVTDGVPTQTYRTRNTLAVGKVRTHAYPNEVAKMLGEVYQSVSVVPTAAAAADADLRVSLGSNYPETVTLAFQDGESGEPLAALVEPGVKGANQGKLSVGGIIFFHTIALAGFGPFIEQMEANKQANNYNTEIQSVTNQRLHTLRSRILNNDELMLTRAQKAELRDLEAQGDSTLANDDPVGALLAYQQALAKVFSGNARALALQAKAVRAAMRITDLPPIPEEAQDLMAQGKAALALAKSPEDYAPASEAMERALTLAPWWATGHFNTALTQEGAGLWSSAANHLRLFLQLDPQTPEREKIRLKIAELELHQKRGDKPVGMAAGQ